MAIPAEAPFIPANASGGRAIYMSESYVVAGLVKPDKNQKV